MSDKARIPLAEAEYLAAELVELLRPGCERIEVAGSIRRRKETIGDIEILAAPRVERGADLFGQWAAAVAVNALEAECSMLVDKAVLQRRTANGRAAWGERYKRAAYRGVSVDLFSVMEPAQWGVVYLIRTGPADFSRRFVTPRHDGGMMPDWARCRDGGIYHVRTGELFPTPEEGDVFRLLGVDWVEPEARA